MLHLPQCIKGEKIASGVSKWGGVTPKILLLETADHGDIMTL